MRGKHVMRRASDCNKLRTPKLENSKNNYFTATGCFFPFSFRSLDFCNFLTNRSTRPSVSTSFCRPVKKGWQLEQISTRRSPLCVERVLKVLPQAQVTFTSS